MIGRLICLHRENPAPTLCRKADKSSDNGISPLPYPKLGMAEWPSQEFFFKQCQYGRVVKACDVSTLF